MNDDNQEQIKGLINKAIKKLYKSGVEFSVDLRQPPDVKADYWSRVAFALAKEVGKKSIDIAEELAEYLRKIDSPYDLGRKFKASAAPPGFLNFKVNDESLHKNLATILKQKDSYGIPLEKEKGSVLVEYFQPNIAKPLHVGHMRSAIIGDAIFRMEKCFVEKVESDTHMGDWGTQFGLLLLAYKKWGNDEEIKKDPINELNKLYVRINEEMENNPDLREQAKAEFVKLEQGDKQNRESWQLFRDWSIGRFNRIYDLLAIRKHDHNWPESEYEDKMQSVVDMLLGKNLLIQSEGAQIVNLSMHKLGTAIIIKSDGGTTYLLRDLAAFLFRKKQGFTKQLYVVDARQKYHFEQLFKILELLGALIPGEVEHIEFGFMSLPDGALSTRKGNIVELEKVIEEAETKAKSIILQKNPNLKNIQTIAKDVGIGALKYFDLSHNRKTDIIFSWQKALNFEGNSGPYIQYTHARIKSILRKTKESGATDSFKFNNQSELDLLRQLVIYPGMIKTSIKRYEPNVLTDYLFWLSSTFNKYYQEVRILQEEDKPLRESRLALLSGVAQVLKNGLALLGIHAPEEM